AHTDAKPFGPSVSPPATGDELHAASRTNATAFTPAMCHPRVVSSTHETGDSPAAFRRGVRRAADTHAQRVQDRRQGQAVEEGQDSQVGREARGEGRG